MSYWVPKEIPVYVAEVTKFRTNEIAELLRGAIYEEEKFEEYILAAKIPVNYAIQGIDGIDRGPRGLPSKKEAQQRRNIAEIRVRFKKVLGELEARLKMLEKSKKDCEPKKPPLHDEIRAGLQGVFGGLDILEKLRKELDMLNQSDD